MNQAASNSGSSSGTSSPMMNAAVERLNRAVSLLEQSYANSRSPGAMDTAKKKSAAAASLERERRACEDIRDVLTSWQLPALQRLDLNRSLGLLFFSLDHRESTIRLLADQALDAVFRKFQLKFQLQRVIVILLTELSKKSPASSFCAALHKLAYTIHFSRAQRAGVYGLHLMNSICASLTRPEDAVHVAVAATFATIFTHVGVHVAAGGAPHAEKAQELFRAALKVLTLSGAAQRAACTVLAALSRHVPLILHKAFYQLADIILKADDSIDGRTRLAGALVAYRLMWPTIIDGLTELSRPALRRILCRVLCLVRGASSNEVLVAALELLSAAVFDVTTPSGLLEFNPLRIEAGLGSRTGATSLEECKSSNVDASDSVAIIFDEMKILGIDDLENLLPKDDAWDASLDLLDGTTSTISEFSPVDRATTPISRKLSQTGSKITDSEADVPDEVKDEEGAVVIVDPLLNCDRYLNADEELVAIANFDNAADDSATPRAQTPIITSCDGVPNELSADICVGHEDEMDFSIYASLSVAQRFLLSGLVVARESGGTLRDDRAVRVSHKILALKCLSMAVKRQWRVSTAAVSRYDGQQSLTDAYAFIGHEDEGLALAAANFLLSSKRASVLTGGQSLESVKILSLLRPMLEACGCDSGGGGCAAQLKGLLQIFTGAADLIIIEERLLAAAGQLVLASMNCDYFLVKIARADFFAALDWRRASAALRRRFQPCFRDALLSQLFDGDVRVRRATCIALPAVIRLADSPAEETSEIFYTGVPDFFVESELRRIPPVLGFDAAKFSLNGGKSTSTAVDTALAAMLRSIHQLAAENFHARASGALAAWRALANAFPPAIHPGPWLAESASPNARNSFLCLLLELANGSAVWSLTDITALANVLAAVLAGIAEQELSKSLLSRHSSVKLSNSPAVGANFPIEQPVLEGVFIFYLRLLNLFHVIVAEEKTRNLNNSTGGSASLLARVAAAAPAAELARKIVSPRRLSTAAEASARQRLHNFSYLVGTAVKPTRSTSYLQSPALNRIEPALAGAYRNFLESINPERHATFLEPLESALDGLCAVLETLNFELHVSTFLDELLLYLRTVFDVSPALSARCVHQCLKAIFGANVRHLNFNTQRSPTITVMGRGVDNGSLPASEPLEALLTRGQHEFTVFTAFAAHPDYLEAFAVQDAGWLANVRPSGAACHDRLAVADRLRYFDPFVTRLMQIYPLSNAIDVRLAILDVLCTLVMNDVRYEMIDNEKKFYWRVVAQVRQPAAGEDVPLLGSLFGFLVALCRVGYLPMSDLVSHLTAALTKIKESGAVAALDALHVVVLESRRLFAECGATTITEDAKGAALREARIFLVREFDFLLAQCPKAAAHLWILLLDSARRFAGSDWWTELSLQFLTCYAIFVEAAPHRRSSALIDFFGVSVAFSCCEPSAFRSIDQLYDCMSTVFDQITKSPNELSSPFHCPNSPDSSLAAAAAATRALPLLFVALCCLDEAIVLFRIDHYDTAANGAERLGADVAGTLLALTRCLIGEDVAWLTENQTQMIVDEALVFLIQIIVYNVHAKRAPTILSAIHRRLCQLFDNSASLNDWSSSNGVEQVDRLVNALALTFPRAHAYWLALLTALDICSITTSRLYFRKKFLSHTKSLIALLFLDKLSEIQKSGYSNNCHKIVGKLTDRGRNTDNDATATTIQESKNCGSNCHDYDEETFFVGGFVEAADDEFCARLLKWSAHPALKRRRPLVAMSNNAAAFFSAKVERFITVNGAAVALKPTLDRFRRGIEWPMNAVSDSKNFTKHSDIIANTFKSSDSLSDDIQIFKADKTDDESGSCPRTDLKFHFMMADQMTSPSDFRKIVAFLSVSSTTDALKIIDCVPLINRPKLYDALFATIDRLSRFSAVETHVNGNVINISSSSRSALCGVALARLEEVGGHSPVETVCILSGLAGLTGWPNDDQNPYVLWLVNDNAQVVDRLFNDLIAYLMMTKLKHVALRSNYFGALDAFFLRPAVRMRFSDDFYGLDQLAPFLKILWTDTIPRWRRLSAPAGGWPIDAPLAANGREMREEIYRLFDIVQRVVHAFRTDSLRIDAQVVSAFRALLRLPLLAKMAAVPSAALRLGWPLVVNPSANGQITIPLIHIHMLANHSDVLSDFIWRLGWLGWTERHQFEEFWMSLLGVLSSTPVTIDELAAAGAQAHAQLHISATAVEALTGLLLAAVGWGFAETMRPQRFFVKHRRRPESYLFLDTQMGRAASSANFWLLSSKDGTVSQRLATNLESDGRPSKSWSDPTTNYNIGQTSLDYLWAITGLMGHESVNSTTKFHHEPDQERPQSSAGIPSSVSHFLLARSTAPDTTSSLRALFDNYLHWAAGGLSAIPIQLLPSVLKSMATLSDLIDDVHLYHIMFYQLRALFPISSGGSSPLDEIDEAACGYATLLLLKCTAVVEWKDLLNNSPTQVGSTAVPLIGDEAEITRLVEALALDSVLFRRSPPSNFVGYCTLHGVLYLLQSLAVDRLAGSSFIGRLADFLMEELRRLRRPVDILTDCSSDTIEYHKLVWTVAFRLIEDALPIDSTIKTSFLKLVSALLVDPRLAGWEKRLLTGGVQALVIHSASYAPAFRLTALECLDTCQLRLSHLRFAIALYSTCFYRELNEGDEPAYELNKSFPADFQKLLNAFLFYATTPDRCDALAPILAGLIGSAWAKERVIAGIWELIAPIGQTALQQNENKISKSSGPKPQSFKSILIFSAFDRALLRLLYETVVHANAAGRRDFLWSFLLPRLADVNCAKFLQFLATLLFCAAADKPHARCRVALLLDGEELILDADFNASAKLLFDNFLEECEDDTPRFPKGASAGPRTRHALLQLLGRVRDESSPSARRQRAAIDLPTVQVMVFDRRRVDIFK